MTEAGLERACKRAAEKACCLWLKIERRKGWPDRLLIDYGLHIWVELKTKRGRLSRLQIKIHEMLRRHKCRVEVIRTVAQFKELLR